MSDEELHISHMAHFVGRIPNVHNDCTSPQGIAVFVNRFSPGSLVGDLISKKPGSESG